MRRISWAGGNCSSYQQAQRALEELGDIRISISEIARITESVGKDLSSFRNRDTPHRRDLNAPRSGQAAVISIDGGRVQLRAQDHARGVHEPQWRETKAAHLQVMNTQTALKDPHPEVPSAFLQQSHVRALVAQLGTNEKIGHFKANTSVPSLRRKSRTQKDDVLLKSCLAQVATAEEFAPIVRNEAERLRLQSLPKRLFLGDGGRGNWLVYEKFFSAWMPLLDFVHLVEHLFAAATAAADSPSAAWKIYTKIITQAWAGKPKEIIKTLGFHLFQLNPKTNQNRIRTLNNTIEYIRDNQSRMDYPSARIQGLPVSSCRVESLIKQINIRIKASDKFWIEPAVNKVLQIRTAELSTTNLWNNFWQYKKAA